MTSNCGRAVCSDCLWASSRPICLVVTWGPWAQNSVWGRKGAWREMWSPYDVSLLSLRPFVRVCLLERKCVFLCVCALLDTPTLTVDNEAPFVCSEAGCCCFKGSISNVTHPASQRQICFSFMIRWIHFAGGNVSFECLTKIFLSCSWTHQKVDFPVWTLRKQTSIDPLLQKLYLLSMIQN